MAGRMEPSFFVLVAGILCGLWDQALGVRLYQAGKGTLAERFRFAWLERRLTIVGSGLVLVAGLLAALDL
jgi:hypothetical protein